MANDNVIDDLQVKVRGDAQSAIATLGKLQTQLRHTAKSIGSVSAAAKTLDTLTRSFNNLNSINVNKLTTAVNQIERLSKIDLKNLDGKSINLDIKVNGADAAERKIYATQEAINKMDLSAFTKRLNQAFNISGATKRDVGNEVKKLFEAMSIGESAGFDATKLWEIIRDNGAIARSAFDVTVQGMKDEYQEFLDYVKGRPFHVSPDAYRSEWSDKTFDQGMGRFFEKVRGSGRQLEADWQELASRFPTIFSADDAAIANEENQIDTIIEKIREAQDVINQKSISLFNQKDQVPIAEHFFGEYANVYTQMEEKFNSLVNEGMKKSAYKIPLDVAVDPERIIAQIEKAIAKASGKSYPLPVKFAVDTEGLKNTVTTALGSVNVKDMEQLSYHLKDASESIVRIGNVDPKSAGFKPFVNSLKGLAEVDLSKVNPEIIGQIVESVSKMSAMGDVKGVVARLVSAIAQLASAGIKAKNAANALPTLGDNLKTLIGDIGSAGGIPSEIIAFSSAIAHLANAGKKTETTANTLASLGTALKEFMGSMQDAPIVSENVIRMTEALGTLASSGGKAGTAAQSIGKSIDKMSSGGQKAYTRLTAIVSIIRDLGNVFLKVGGYVKQGASKIVDSLKKIKNAGRGLDGAAASIRNMIGAMIGFRGIAGLGNLIKETIQLGAAMTEIDHIVESVFGDMAGYVDNWAKSAITQFGIAEHKAKQYAGVLSSMFQASNIGYMDAGKMSMDLVGLAGDLSAFYNIDTETAFNKIRSGMAGMVRPLRDLGIDLTAATLQEFALSQGITQSYSAMSQAEKVMLRYQYLMANTKTQQGDFGFGMVA